MEIIVVTDNKEYSQVIPGSRIIPKQIIDVCAIIQTQIFFNHHYHLSLYFLNDNQSSKYQLPLKIASQLLDRSDSQPLILIINDKQSIVLDDSSDLMQVFSKIQVSYIQSQSQIFRDSDQNYKNQGKYCLKYCFKYWEISVEIVFVEVSTIYEMYLNNFREKSEDTPLQQSLNSQKIVKIILEISSQNQEQLRSLFHNLQLNQKQLYEAQQLSQEYLKLKQQAQNQTNMFRKKIRIVEAILGENIIIDRLLREQNIKDGNSEFQRLKSIFETIQNIDTVLIEQEKNLENIRLELKKKRESKSMKQYQNAKKIAEYSKQNSKLQKDIDEINFKIESVNFKKETYLNDRSFDVTASLKLKLNENINNMRRILKTSTVHFYQNVSKQAMSNALHTNILPNRIVSTKISKIKHTQSSSYQNLNKKFIENLRNRASPMIKHAKQPLKTNDMRDNKQINDFKALLLDLHKYHQSIHQIASQISSFKKQKPSQNPLKNYQKQFPTLQMLLSESIDFKNINKLIKISQSEAMLIDERKKNLQQQKSSFKINKFSKKTSFVKSQYD